MGGNYKQILRHFLLETLEHPRIFVSMGILESIS